MFGEFSQKGKAQMKKAKDVVVVHNVFGSTPHRFGVKSGQSIGGDFFPLVAF